MAYITGNIANTILDMLYPYILLYIGSSKGHFSNRHRYIAQEFMSDNNLSSGSKVSLLKISPKFFTKNPIYIFSEGLIITFVDSKEKENSILAPARGATYGIFGVDGYPSDFNPRSREGSDCNNRQIFH